MKRGRGPEAGPTPPAGASYARDSNAGPELEPREANSAEERREELEKIAQTLQNFSVFRPDRKENGAKDPFIREFPMIVTSSGAAAPAETAIREVLELKTKLWRGAKDPRPLIQMWAVIQILRQNYGTVKLLAPMWPEKTPLPNIPAQDLADLFEAGILTLATPKMSRNKTPGSHAEKQARARVCVLLRAKGGKYSSFGRPQVLVPHPEDWTKEKKEILYHSCHVAVGLMIHESWKSGTDARLALTLGNLVTIPCRTGGEPTGSGLPVVPEDSRLAEGNWQAPEQEKNDLSLEDFKRSRRGLDSKK